MSKELKPCPFCGTDVVPWGQEMRRKQVVEVFRHPPFTGCALESLTFTLDDWNKRHDPNPWRYPAKGELPEEEGEYLVSLSAQGSVRNARDVSMDMWQDGGWTYHLKLPIYAFKKLDEPAPQLEEEKK